MYYLYITNNELNILDLMTEKDVHQLKTNLLSVLNENILQKCMDIQYSLRIFYHRAWS